MVELTRGNLLDADVEALVNTVNTVGVMGKGIALQFRKAFPRVYDAYKRACDAGEIKPGRMHIAQTEQVQGPRLVINFPTKRHWRGRSRLEDIEAGLDDLARVLGEWEVRSVAVPPLGCGNGGLDWDDVRPRIVAALSNLSDTRVLLYEPTGPPPVHDQPVRTSRPKMTRGRASLLTALATYQSDPAARITLLVVQKLAYLLQVSGEPLRLNFVKGQYGPYAEAINHVLQRMDGHFLLGYGDRTARAQIVLDPDAAADAAEFLARDPDALDRLTKLRALIDGFESPLGLELLTTVHWAAQEGHAASPDEAAGFVAAWNPRKRRVFAPGHIAAAMDRLGAFDLLESSASRPDPSPPGHRTAPSAA